MRKIFGGLINCSNFGKNIPISPLNSQSMFRGRNLQFPRGKNGVKGRIVLWLKKLSKVFGQCGTDIFFSQKLQEIMTGIITINFRLN